MELVIEDRTALRTGSRCLLLIAGEPRLRPVEVQARGAYGIYTVIDDGGKVHRVERAELIHPA